MLQNSKQVKHHPSGNLKGLINPDSGKPGKSLQSSTKVKLSKQDRLLMKIISEKFRTRTVDQLKENS